MVLVLSRPPMRTENSSHLGTNDGTARPQKRMKCPYHNTTDVGNNGPGSNRVWRDGADEIRIGTVCR